MFTSRFLSRIRTKALRRGVLYSALDGLERGILCLSARVVDRVRSGVLGAQLVDIVMKLGEALKCGFTRHVESYGVRQAVRVVQVAVGFGSRVAHGWLNGLGFARYLAFIDYNRR